MYGQLRSSLVIYLTIKCQGNLTQEVTLYNGQVLAMQKRDSSQQPRNS